MNADARIADRSDVSPWLAVLGFGSLGFILISPLLTIAVAIGVVVYASVTRSRGPWRVAAIVTAAAVLVLTFLLALMGLDWAALG